MTVHCPHCSTGYLLPDHLLGPRGARVRCPNCQRPFVVLREDAGGESVAGSDARAAERAAAPAPELAPTPAPPPDPARADVPQAEAAVEEDAGALAARLLDALAGRLGGGLAEARSRGRVLAEFGPEVMKAYDEYRERLGARATAESFRAALRERWGVDLAPGVELRRE